MPVNAAVDPAGEILAPRVALVHRLAMRRGMSDAYDRLQDLITRGEIGMA